MSIDTKITKTLKTQDSKFSTENLHKSLKDKLINASFSVACPLNSLSQQEINNYKINIDEYIDNFNQTYKDLNPDEIKNQFLIDDLNSLKEKDYNNLFYVASKSCKFLKSLISGKIIEIIEQDECLINHIKTIESIIQFCLTAITYIGNRKKLKEGKLFTLSDLKIIPGFVMKLTDNGLIDVENSYFINHVTGNRIKTTRKLFDFNFKMLIEGYSSPNKQNRKLTIKQSKIRDKYINAYLLDKLDGPSPDSKKMKFKKFKVLTKKGTPSKHTVELRPVVQCTHVQTIGDLLNLIYTFHYNQGLVYKKVGSYQKFVRNSEHGNGKCPIFNIGNNNYEICYLINEDGSPKQLSEEERTNFKLSEHNYKIVTEARHYGDDVRCTFNGYNASFGTGNKFDILLIK